MAQQSARRRPVRELDAREIESELLQLQQRASQLVRLVLRKVDSDIPKSMAGLLHLVSEEPMRVTEIAKIEGLAQPTVTALVNQAEKRGWVQRTPDPVDGRSVLVEITESGTRARKELHASIMTLLGERSRQLKPAQLRALIATSDALVPMIEAIRGPESGA